MGKKPKVPFTNFNNHKKHPRLSQEGLKLAYPHIKYVCGIDSAGSGCGAGPMTTGCVVLPIDSDLQVKDSKKYTTERQRQKAAALVEENVLWHKVIRTPAYKLNEIGITKAEFNAVVNLLSLVLQPTNWNETIIIFDGAYIPKGLPATLKNFTILAIPEADVTIKACSAASIIAKVERDNFMNEIAELDEFKHYGFEQNKGYLTKEHLAALKVYGPSVQHRTFVKPIKEIINGKKEFV